MIAAIRLHPHDNVVVCCRTVRGGERVEVDGVPLVVGQDIELGHKMALVPFAKGDKVLKYGMPIGSMTLSAAPGEWVHMHNMKSDYISAHTRATSGDAA